MCIPCIPCAKIHGAPMKQDLQNTSRPQIALTIISRIRFVNNHPAMTSMNKFKSTVLGIHFRDNPHMPHTPRTPSATEKYEVALLQVTNVMNRYALRNLRTRCARQVYILLFIHVTRKTRTVKLIGSRLPQAIARTDILHRRTHNSIALTVAQALTLQAKDVSNQVVNSHQSLHTSRKRIRRRNRLNHRNVRRHRRQC